MFANISIQPDICHGQACVKGTRIPVHQIVKILANGDSIDDLIREYPTQSYGCSGVSRLCSVFGRRGNIAIGSCRGNSLNIFVDENFPKRTVHVLRECGNDVLDIRGVDESLS